MVIVRDISQGTDEWHNFRLASIGGTAINKIVPKGKGYSDCLFEFVGEYLTGVKAESFKFQHAQRGHDFEPKARAAYKLRTGKSVEQVALVRSDKPHRHYSPDGLIGDNGILEIKVRIPSVFLKLAEGELEPIEDRRQRQWGLYICERDYVDSVNYCPELDQAGKDGLLIKRIERIETVKENKKTSIEALKQAADTFIGEMLELINKYN